MPSLTKSFILTAIADTTWDLGNAVLYRLCAEHPGHGRSDEIIAKIWLIGRAYAAAIERRKEEGEAKGDDFYTKMVVPHIRKNGVDLWFEEFTRVNAEREAAALKLHKRLLDLFHGISGMQKRSLASKYLHFHFPDDFFIYDARAEAAMRDIRRELHASRLPRQDQAFVDTTYTDFFERCIWLRQHIKGLIGRAVTPRQLDKVLLAWRTKAAAPPV
jgi:hypothetical protein